MILQVDFDSSGADMPVELAAPNTDMPVDFQNLQVIEKSGGTPSEIKIGEGLKYDDQGRIAVNTANKAELNNTLPITSSAVAVQIGNIDALLSKI